MKITIHSEEWRENLKKSKQNTLFNDGFMKNEMKMLNDKWVEAPNLSSLETAKSSLDFLDDFIACLNCILPPCSMVVKDSINPPNVNLFK